MSTIKRDFPYHCSDGCNQGGCPGHIAHMEYKSTAEILSFDSGNGYRFCMDRSQLQAFLFMLKDIGKVRVEIEHTLKDIFDIGIERWD